MKIAIAYICTGEYIKFWPDFHHSAESHLLPGTRKHYFVFTDGHLAPSDETTVISQDSLGWPFNTLYRFRMILRIRERLQAFSHIVFLNANCVVQRTIDFDEFFGQGADLVACVHPGFFNKPSAAHAYERRPRSRACVAGGAVYRAGGLMGGKTAVFLAAAEELAANIEDDLSRGVLALWHDESHWNAYLHARVPTLGLAVHDLTPGYLYPESWTIPFEPSILLREKSKVIDVDRIKGHTSRTPANRDRTGTRGLARSLWARMTFGR